MATSYGTFFLSVTGLFCCLFIGYLCYSSYTLNLSQKRIKDYYINHINKADSLCFSISAYNTELIENIQKRVYQNSGTPFFHIQAVKDV